MTVNTFEQLIAEWYELRGYFVRRNIPVGKGAKGGWEGELDVVAFHPSTKHMVHIEASTSGDSWKKLKPRIEKQFAAGRTHIPLLYPNLDLPSGIDQIFVLYRRMRSDKQIEGVQMVPFEDLLNEMRDYLKLRDIHKAKVPETFSLLRVLHHAVYYRPASCASEADSATKGRRKAGSASRRKV